MSRRTESTEFLKECTADALLQLLKEKPLSKISVEEITNTAGVSRITYFRHFESKEKLLQYKLYLVWKQFAEKRKLENADRYHPDNAVPFFEFNLSNRGLLEMLYRENLSSLVLQVFIQIFGEKRTEEEGYEAAFYEYGLFGVLNRWVLNGFRESPEEMAEIGLRITERTGMH